MPAIAARWEWRTFGDRLGAAADRLSALTPESTQVSDELYLLSVEGIDAVKVRDGLMDVKHLEHVNSDGLEQWRPILKAAFPIAAADAVIALEALRASIPLLARTVYTLDQLVDEVVRPSDHLLALQVGKTRHHHTVGGCMAELTEVRTEHGLTWTIAVESEDASRVSAAVQELGLAGRPNVNFPRGLKLLAGFGGQRYAVVDVGTNSVKFHIGERGTDGAWRRVVDRSEVTRLGEGLDATGRLNQEPMERTIEAVAGMADEARVRGALATVAVGTAGVRAATNSAEFVEAVRVRCGLTLEVISGEEEGRLAYRAVTSGLGPTRGTMVVFDTGGGSSQFTFGHDGHIDERFSLKVGAVRFTERYGLTGVVSDQALAAALDSMSADLAPLNGRAAPDVLVAIGGAVTNLAAVRHGLALYDPDVVEGTMLDRAEIDRQIELYRGLTLDARREIVGLQPKRAEVILAGACIVRTVMEKLGRESLRVSDRGLRHGVLIDRFERTGSP